METVCCISYFSVYVPRRHSFMASTDSCLSFALEQLGSVATLRTRPMFGAVSIYGNDVIFAMVHEGQLYFKVGPHNLADFEAAESEPFRPYGDDRTMPYWTVPPDILDDQDAMVVWGRKALEGATAAKKGKK